MVDDACATLYDNVKGLQAMQAAKVTFVTTKDSYLKTLKAAFDNPPDEVNAAVYKNAVIMLDKELKSIDSTIAGEISSRMSVIAGHKAFDDQYINLVTRIRKTIDSAQAIIARTKVDQRLTVAELNDNMDKAARDISTQLNNIALLQKKGYDVQLAPPAGDMAYLNTWHTAGSPSKLPGTATRHDMDLALILMDTHVEAIDRWANSVNV
jgi:hypothetical protein